VVYRGVFGSKILSFFFFFFFEFCKNNKSVCSLISLSQVSISSCLSGYD
jgi:hypothetical protein